MRTIFNIATYLYSVVIWLIAVPIVKFVGIFNRNLKYQFQGRRLDHANLAGIFQRLDKSRKTALYLCSSAGEYEQALPVIEQMESSLEYNTVICFVSKSGMRFAESRGESRPFFLAPVDTIWDWRRVLRVLKPDTAFVVRYEVWPAFAAAFSSLRRLVLIDASRSARVQTDVYYHWALSCFTHIFCTSDKDQKYFRECLGNSHPKIVVSGDTKYDRVLQRSQSKSKRIDAIQATLAAILRDRKVVIVGSAWESDMRIMAPAFAKVAQLSSNSPLLLVVPHDLSPSNIQKIRSPLDAEKITTMAWNEVQGANAAKTTNEVKVDCLIMDTLGILFDLYRMGHAAMIGGATHFKVHNVLEPATFNLPICFGPYYTTQKEAVQMVDRGFATVVKDHNDVVTWFQSIDKNDGSMRSTRHFVESLAGATNCIIRHLDETRSQSDAL